MLQSGAETRCSHCGTESIVLAFPALSRAELKPQFGESILVEGESSCFYHATKRAAAACDQCGRFLCSLCDIAMDGRHICPSCLQANRNDPAKTRMVTRHVLYDNMAMDASVVPVLLCWPVSFITAPVAVFLVIRHFFNTKRPIPRNSWRAWVALLFSVATLGVWVYVVGSTFLTGSF